MMDPLYLDHAPKGKNTYRHISIAVLANPCFCVSLLYCHCCGVMCPKLVVFSLRDPGQDHRGWIAGHVVASCRESWGQSWFSCGVLWIFFWVYKPTKIAGGSRSSHQNRVIWYCYFYVCMIYIYMYYTVHLMCAISDLWIMRIRVDD